ncbi:MAG: hypothetical protein WED81_04070 [Rhodothermales bacterium]
MPAAQKAQARHTVRKPRASQTRPEARALPGAGTKGKSGTLPGWNELATANQRLIRGDRGNSFLEKISTKRFALLIVVTAILCTLYVGHVHATQDLLAEVQRARRENLRLHLKYNRLKGEFDRMIGPSAIYGRASGIGLIEDPAFGPTIRIEDSW